MLASVATKFYDGMRHRGIDPARHKAALDHSARMAHVQSGFKFERSLPALIAYDALKSKRLKQICWSGIGCFGQSIALSSK